MNIAPTSDGAARPNGMTVNQWLDYVLDSDQVTRVTQHLALVIFALAVRQQQSGVSASVRDLERMTGWSKSMINDHLGELKDVIRMTPGVGRRKSIFELQSLIEDAVKTIVAPVVSANARTLDQNSVRQCADATADAIPDAKPPVRPLADANPDTKPSVRSKPDAIPDAKPSIERENRERESGATVVQVNCSAIYGPGFKLDFGAIDMAAGLSGVDIQRARQIAEICARDWAANGVKPSSPMAMVKRAIASDRNQKQTDEARQARPSRNWRDDIADKNRRMREAIAKLPTRT